MVTFNLLLITRNLPRILAKPGLLLTQHGLKLFNIIRKLSFHTSTLQQVTPAGQPDVCAEDVSS